MKSLLSFETLITPKFIKFFFYLAVIFCCFSGFGTFLSILISFNKSAELTGSSEMLANIMGLILGLLAGSIVTLVGVIVARVSSELTLVIFMIRDELAWQRENASTRIDTSAS